MDNNTIEKESNQNEFIEYDLQILIFRLAEKLFALDILKVLEILKPMGMTRLPNAPFYVLGVINLRGEIIPILDLKRLFGLGDVEITKASRVIETDFEGKKVGLLVEEVQQVSNIKLTSIESPGENLSGISSQYFEGYVFLKNEIVSLLKSDYFTEIFGAIEDKK